MDNTSISPAANAANAFDRFVILMKSDKDQWNEFGIWLEDFMVNDHQYQKYNDTGKSINIGCLCYMMTVVYESSVHKFHLKTDYFSLVCKSFGSSLEPEQIMLKYLEQAYLWDGTSFRFWDNDKWCIIESLMVNKFVYDTYSNTYLRNFGCSDKFVVDAVDSMNLFLQKITSFAFNIKMEPLTERLIQIFSSRIDDKSIIKAKILTVSRIPGLLKHKHNHFNKSPLLIPCHSGTVELKEKSMRKCKRTDYFTVTLPFDPASSEEITVLSENFLTGFKCNDIDLATMIISCASRLEPTLTIINGPSGSGKTTLLSILKILYGPFATDNFHDKVNYDLVRTCFIDDESILQDEEHVKIHPCKHLVVSCESSSIPRSWGGRLVNHLHFEEKISDPVSDIVRKLSTRKQLGSIFGWALKH